MFSIQGMTAFYLINAFFAAIAICFIRWSNAAVATGASVLLYVFFVLPPARLASEILTSGTLLASYSLFTDPVIIAAPLLLIARLKAKASSIDLNGNVPV